MEGPELPGVFPLDTMGDSFAVHHYLEERQPESAAIIGAGYIGLEMADALVHRGIHATLASRTETILPTVDPDFGRRVEAEMRRHGVDVCNRVEVRSIRREGNKLIVAGNQSFPTGADLVRVAVGVQPNSELGVAAGISSGVKGALTVNRRMEPTCAMFMPRAIASKPGIDY
jgi:pyruvate/2-oxoglutarate dehydrogenase complex dihydrolipoamide dehydrogenase (E3) component